MNVFQIAASEGFEWVQPVAPADIDRLRFDGKPMSMSWTPLRMQSVTADEWGHHLAPSDFPSCSGGDMLMLREDAYRVLRDPLGPYGEFLPLECDRGRLWAFNVTRLVDALDEEQSDVLRLAGGTRLLRIIRHVFRSEQLRDQYVFKLSTMTRGLICVTDAFVARVRSTNLRGIEFKRMWGDDSERLRGAGDFGQTN